jgi:hypothetical protein
MMYELNGTVSTYNKAIHQLEDAVLAAAPNKESPIRAIVGAMERGPMKRMRTPMTPLKPMTTWKHADAMIAPWICEMDEK